MAPSPTPTFWASISLFHGWGLDRPSYWKDAVRAEQEDSPACPPQSLVGKADILVNFAALLRNARLFLKRSVDRSSATHAAPPCPKKDCRTQEIETKPILTLFGTG